MNTEIVDTIKKMVKVLLPDARIVLFGSQANGNADENSDYDLLIITAATFTQKEKFSYYSNLRKAIIKAIHVPVDLLLYSEAEIIEKQELPGHIVRSAMREGRML